MSTKVVRCNKFEKIEPSAVIYVRVSSKKEEVLSSTLKDQSDKSFPVKETLDDSDTQSQDNWRNKDKNEKICRGESSIINKSMNETPIDKNNTSQFSVLSERSFHPTLMINNQVYPIIGIKKIIP
ncbi:unnamed protein product [Lasius platythorax]|uniref:Uncharacterized protein n=1 Tax=Lasius platythorax TaxID=488582 RepID=A0AAV2N0I6_9HYME